MTNRGTPAQRNWGARIRDYTWQGMRLLVLENEMLRVGVLAGKGADIVELNYKPRDLDLVWLAPNGVRNPADSGGMFRDPLATFVETYPGGWQEVFPNGGAPSSHAGAQYGQHDEVFALPWEVEVVEDTEEHVGVRFTVRTHKVPCVIEKTLWMTESEPAFRIEERLTNHGAVPVQAMWGHHITYGPPYLRPGSRIRLPEGVRVLPHGEAIAPGGRRIANDEPFAWPVARGEDGLEVDLSVVPDRDTPSDIAYLTGFPNDIAWYEIVDPGSGLGSRIEWDAARMPYLWYWQEFGATTGYPWYGRNYNIGLEPFSSFPTNGLAAAVENGSALVVQPNETLAFWMSMAVLDEQRGRGT